MTESNKTKTWVEKFVPIIALTILFGLGAAGYLAAQKGLPWQKRPPLKLTADAKAIVKASNKFGFDLLSKFDSEKGNVVFSPFSIYTALTMIANGANGDTLNQFSRALHFPFSIARVNNGFQPVLDIFNRSVEGSPTVTMANAIWIKKGTNLLDEFEDKIETLGAGARSLDMEGDPKGSLHQINQWASETTKGKISEIIKKFSGKPQMILTNAVYFLGGWSIPFSEQDTKPQPFTRRTNEEVEVPFMHLQGHFTFYRGKKYQMLELPYGNRQFSCILILPRKNTGLPQFEKSLTATSLGRAIQGMRTTSVDVIIPKFKFGFRRELQKDLSAMGLSDAFKSGADFSGLDGEGGSWISTVLHESVIDVSEKGTEAAAVTSVEDMPASITYDVSTFLADHPFLFLIRHNKSGAILFLGRVMDPSIH